MYIPESTHEIAPLILKYFREELTAEEGHRLDNWRFSSEANRVFFDNISNEKIVRVDYEFDEEGIFEKIIDKLHSPEVLLPPTFHRQRIFKHLVLILIITIFALAAWLLLRK